MWTCILTPRIVRGLLHSLSADAVDISRQKSFAWPSRTEVVQQISSPKGAAMLRQAALQGLARARGGTLQRAIQTSTASCQDKVKPEGLQPACT